MSHTIRCHTLFDISKTGILNRRHPTDMNEEQLALWNNDRNRQCNFDTILQVISLRSQPENISSPKKEEFKFEDCDSFGFLFDTITDEVINKWIFEFTVNYQGVFNDGINELGALYTDCDSVPMITGLSEWQKVPNFLDISPELKNIHFEVLND